MRTFAKKRVGRDVKVVDWKSPAVHRQHSNTAGILQTQRKAGMNAPKWVD